MTPALQRELEPVAGQAVKALELDPVTILLVIQAIAALLQIIRECREWKVRWSIIRDSGKTRVGQGRMRRAILQEITQSDYERIGGERFLQWASDHAQLLKAADIDNLLYLAGE